MAAPLYMAGKYQALLSHPATLGAAVGGGALLGPQLGLDDRTDVGQGRRALETLGSTLYSARAAHEANSMIKANPWLGQRLNPRQQTAAAMLAAGIGAPIGNLLGGGIANVANLIGIPGMSPGGQNQTINQNLVVDPESMGSSNTQSARASMYA